MKAVSLENTGHGVFVDDPKSFNETLAGFLKGN